MNIRHINLIAARDFWAIVQTKSFIIGLFAFLFLMSVAPGMLFLYSIKNSYRIALVDPTGTYAAELSKLIPDSLFTITPLPATGPDRVTEAQLLERIRQKEFFGSVEVIPHPGQEDSFLFSSSTLADPTPHQTLHGVLRQIVRERRALRMGIPRDKIDTLFQDIKLETVKVTPAATEKAGEKDFALAFIIPIGMVFGLYGLISFQSERLLTALLEEKMKRLLEVLLTRVTIYELLLGKMLGILYVGGLLYLGVGLFVRMVGAWFNFTYIPPPTVMIFYTLFYITGYLLYGSFYAAIGAACGSQKDAENLSMPLRMLLMLPITISVYVNIHPQSGGTLFFTYFPLTAPFVMTNRMVVADIPLFEALLSLAGVVAASAFGLWAATRVFEASLASPGRSLGLKEIWRSLGAARPVPLGQKAPRSN